ncbi:UNVERIFIED_CONTAM: Retrovirus-related Pol polyprotein from transposon TNT 1-94 [Sesamum latifolium]|uniref:Retrovirus-related Pol polyprotein from transposon TNT 1-94 n=1 Tax=Sesamum latifolium TaxID=2727402 RepID=A0AAW2XZU9_9LAMI
MSDISYASAIGSIQYIVQCTKPDIAYALSVTSNYQTCAGEAYWSTVKTILKNLKRTKDMFLIYDFVFKLNDGVVAWKSSKQATTADSTTEAEYIAASEAAKEAVWMKNYIQELGVVPRIAEPVVIFCDNNGAIAQAKELRSHHRFKHILRRYHLLREMGVSLVCPLCCSENEDIEHVFIHCPFVRQVWALSYLRWGLVSVLPSDPCGWVEHLAKNLSIEDFARFITICWVVWWNRNRALMERSSLSAVKIALKISPARWSPPRLGEVKLNFDEAIFALSSEIGLGVIARDSDGACVGWNSVHKKGLLLPEMVEAFAAREAILLACRFGWRRIILEGDYVNLQFKLS